MTEGGALRPPAVDRRATDLESSRCLGAGHAAIESCEHSDTKVFGVGFHASQATIPSRLLHVAIEILIAGTGFPSLHRTSSARKEPGGEVPISSYPLPRYHSVGAIVAG